jgi:phage repressor protein C with HTH and peptisase S24 domain/DNA-binding XRE family transcriptional regulator
LDIGVAPFDPQISLHCNRKLVCAQQLQNLLHMKTLGDQVRTFREERGWNSKQMADAVGTSRQNIESLEARGNRIPKYLGQLAVVMGRPVDDLLAEAGLASAAAAAREDTTGFLTGFEQLSVPVLSSGGSMGGGHDTQHDDVVVGRLTLSPNWISKTIKPSKPENLRFIHGYGDSMEPTFFDGDVLLVDTGIQDIKVDGIYVLEANERLYIKRVRQRLDGTFEISSDNPNVRTVDVLDGTRPVTVKGRISWLWNGRKV